MCSCSAWIWVTRKGKSQYLNLHLPQRQTWSYGCATNSISCFRLALKQGPSLELPVSPSLVTDKKPASELWVSWVWEIGSSGKSNGIYPVLSLTTTNLLLCFFNPTSQEGKRVTWIWPGFGLLWGLNHRSHYFDASESVINIPYLCLYQCPSKCGEHASWESRVANKEHPFPHLSTHSFLPESWGFRASILWTVMSFRL